MSKTIDWWGCYDDGWRDLIVPDAFQHPAKYRPGLIERIYEHGFDRGWWQKGSLIGDCFGGIGGGGIIAAFKGLAWISVELEPRFCELAKRNFDLHRKGWEAAGDPIPEIIQGDSREFAKLVSCSAIVTSPPFVDQEPYQDKSFRLNDGRKAKPQGQDGYGSTPGQIGNLKAGKLDSVVTSPPYAGSPPESNSKSVDLEKQYETYRKSGGGASFKAFCATQEKHSSGYGTTHGNIGNLKAIVTSPPYADSVKGEHGETETAKESRDKRETPGGSLGQSQRHGGYGSTEGNIGNLKACVTSPPFGMTGQAPADGGNDSTINQKGREYARNNYGDTQGNIGNDKSESYWQAMEAVYDQCRQAIRPGGMLVVVVKDFVKGGKRVPLCDQTLALLESLGFVLVERIRAWVTKTTVHAGLFGDVEQTKSKKSFFRRLAEKKGSPPIDWEEVLCVRTP